jgi:S-adenosyl-L-methionine hydrolase (adenosine-forming)
LEARLIITLTTDFGLRDAYAAVMKGVILSANPEVRIVDITHGVSPHQIGEAAFILETAYRYFPQGTIHLGIVDPGVGTDRAALLVDAGGYCFLAPDNGLLKYVFDAHPDAAVYQIIRPERFSGTVSRTFHGRDVFAPVAAQLSRGVTPERLGERFMGFIRGDVRKPVIGSGRISGEILYIDGFGNAVTNIEGLGMDPFGKIRVQVRRFSIRGIRPAYAAIPAGKPGALIGSHGNLEIAISGGSAQKAMRLKTGDPVKVFF